MIPELGNPSLLAEALSLLFLTSANIRKRTSTSREGKPASVLSLQSLGRLNSKQCTCNNIGWTKTEFFQLYAREWLWKIILMSKTNLILFLKYSF